MAKGTGGGKNYRSAISGRFVKRATEARHPSTTVAETIIGDGVSGGKSEMMEGEVRLDGAKIGRN